MLLVGQSALLGPGMNKGDFTGKLFLSTFLLLFYHQIKLHHNKFSFHFTEKVTFIPILDEALSIPGCLHWTRTHSVACFAQ